MKYECVVQKSCVMVRVKAEWTTDRRWEKDAAWRW
jgi:hypothetical protein